MSIIFAFLPFLVFAVLSSVYNAVVGLAVGAAVSAALVIRTYWYNQHFKILECGTFILLLGLATYALITRRQMSIVEVRLVVDLGLFFIILGSILVGHPFSMQYAKDKVAEPTMSSKPFIRKNYLITASWACVFFIFVVVEGAIITDPSLPKPFATAVIVAALAGGTLYTRNLSKSNIGKTP